ncbi:MAG TPA: hypothetical protein ENI63_00890 [Candidatus Kaiserbacteria bacterium]|nr:hypothetical protein [Candidatus Kaiserbacteria bacterium]
MNIYESHESLREELERIYSHIHPSVVEQLESCYWISAPQTSYVERAILLLERIEQQKLLRLV